MTQADIDNNGGGDGDIDNTATADSDQTGPVTDSAAVPLAQSPALTIEKTVTGVDGDTTPPFLVDAAGDVISYSILVTNTGNQTLTGVSVADPRIANLDCDPGTAGNQTTGFTLAPTGTLTCTGTYAVTQADIDNNGGGDGDIDNTATADSDQTEPVTDSAAVPLEQSPALAIEKTVTGVDADTTPPFLVDAAGDVISYSILVTNTGNQTLTGCRCRIRGSRTSTATPALAGNQTTGFTLAPTETLTCTGTYTVTQADIDDNGGGDGDIDNTATADSDQTGPETDSAAVPLAQSPALTIEKTVTGVDADTTPPFSVDAAGDVISYSILVTNTGNQTLTAVSVTDPRIANLDCDPTTGRQPDDGLHPGADRDADLHGQYTVTQAEIDNNGGGDGDIDNTATADSDQTGPVSDSAAVPLGQSPALAIEKTVTGVDADTTPPFLVDAAGDVISYSILVTNTGNQTLTGVSVSDPRIANLDCDPNTAGNQTTGLHARPDRDADLHRELHGDAGRHRQQRRRRRRHRQHRHRRQRPDRAGDRLGGGAARAGPALTIEKTVTGVDADTTPPFLVDAAGDVISYSILVTNTGNQTLTGVSVSDPRIANLDCDPGHRRQPDDRLHAGPGRDVDLHRDVHGDAGRDRRQRWR